MANNQYVNRVTYGTNTLIDLTGDTVAADKMLSGTTAHDKSGAAVTGNISSKAAATYTPTTTDQTIASGQYLSGAQTIKGDANLVAANIAKNVTIFGVTGSHEGGGGGGGAVSSSDVNFYDYDGTIVASYSASDFASLSALPANPSHTGLTAQGWNRTLANAKTYVATYGKLNIGQMYITSDGKTRIYIRLEDGRLSPMLGVCPNGTVTVDWGDGSANATLTGTSVSTVKWTSRHTYPSAGDYTITLTVSGSMGLMGSDTATAGSYLLKYSSASDNRNYGYRNAIQRVEIGSGVTSIGNYAFYHCYSLASITIPSNVTSLGTYAFQSCYSLTNITIPSGVTSIGMYAFNSCCSLASITIPSSVTSIGIYALGSCYILTSITIPSNVMSIGNYAFYRCYSLASITIPSNVKSIGSDAFNSCYSLGYIKFTRSTPPTVSNSNAWTSVPTDCKIYVPSANLSTYTSATNYPSSSTYTYVGY